MADVTIIRDAEMPSFDPARAGKKDRLVIYQAGPGAFGSVTLPSETATEERIIALIKQDLAARRLLVGRILSIP